MTLPFWLVIGFMSLVSWLQWKTYRYVTGRRKFKKGDIVLYVNPGQDDYQNNMITHIMDVFPDGSVSLCTRGSRTLVGFTTGGCPLDRLHLLPVDRNYPLQLPGEPVSDGYYGQNRAKWIFIPLNWFTYDAPPQKKSG